MRRAPQRRHLSFTYSDVTVGYRDLDITTLQILSPLPDQPIGIGMFVRAQTDFIGPLPTGSFYEAHLFPAVGERDLATSRLYTQLPAPEMVLGEVFSSETELQLVTLPQESSTPHGTAARLSVTLSTPTEPIADTTTIPVVLDALTGLQWAVGHAMSSTIQGGFTESDRVQLVATHEAVYSGLPLTTTGGGVVQVGLDAILKGPPIDLLSEDQVLFLSGRNTVNRPSGSTGVYAYGCRWRIESAPAGLGKLDGQLVEYEQRIVQFVLVKTRLGGGDYVAQVEDSHLASGEMQWSLPFPVRLDYDVLPGVVLRFTWLLLLQ